jgi:quinolinate synthase
MRGRLQWAFARGKRILFLPDQHLGRNTGYAMGIPLEEMAVWDPWGLAGRADETDVWLEPRAAVEGPLLSASAVSAQPRGSGAREVSGIQVIVHPECRWEVCQKADALGSTERLIALVEEAPAGTMFAVGTEIHLVNRMARRFAAEGKRIITLDDTGCLCTTMYRISPQHLAWALENLVEGRVVNRIAVRANVKQWARVALDRMLEIR